MYDSLKGNIESRVLSLVLTHLTCLPATWGKELLHLPTMQMWCGISTFLYDRIRIVETDMEGSDKDLKVNYREDNCRLPCELPSPSKLPIQIQKLRGIVLIDVLGRRA